MDILQILRSWWLIVAILLISVGIGIIYTFQQPNIYEAQTAFILRPSEGVSETRDMVSSLDTLSRRTGLTATYCGVIESQAVFNRALVNLNVPATTGELYSVNCSVRPDTSVLQLYVQGPSRALAQDLAYEIGEAATLSAKSIQDVFTLDVLDPAQVQRQPVAPNHNTDVALAGIIGLVVGTMMAVFRALLAPEPQVVTREERPQRIYDLEPIPMPSAASTD